MQYSYMASLCYKGLRGGALYLDEENIIYRNQTQTMPENLKNIVIPLKSITKLTKMTVIPFPAVELETEKGKYRFVIINRAKFLKDYYGFTKEKILSSGKKR